MILEFNLGKTNGTILKPLRYVHRDYNYDMQKNLILGIQYSYGEPIKK